MAKDANGNSIYYCTATLPTAGTVNSVSYGGTAVEHFTQSGTTLRMWLPAGTGRALRIDTQDGAIYTAIPASINNNYTDLTLSRAFDINVSAITVTSGSSANTVNYNGNNFSIGNTESFTVLGSTTKPNTIIVQGGYTVKMRFDNLFAGIANLPLSVTGSSTARITLSGTNSLASSGSFPAIRVENGSHLALTGESGSSLTASASQTGQQDIDNSGGMTLDGNLTLTALNDKFKPNVVIPDAAIRTVTVKLGATAYYRVRLPDAAGTASGVKYADTDLDVLADRYYTDAAVTTWFWMQAATADNRSLVFAGSKPKSGNLYSLPAQDVATHNVQVSVTPVPAFITQASSKNTYYGTLSEAFAAATNGQTITLASDQTLTNATVAPARLAAGESVNLELLNYKLTATGTSTLSAGKGILRIGTDVTTTGGLSGTFVIDGCIYSALAAAQLGNFQRQGGQTVYRVWVSNLPVNMSSRLTYRTDGGMEYEAARETGKADNRACIWLPLNVQMATIADILPTVNEPVATVRLTVVNNHDNNTISSLPKLDITYGNIVVVPGSSKTSVTYGSRSYQAQTDAGTSKLNRLPIQGTATADNGKDYRVEVAAGATGTAYLSLQKINIQPTSPRAAIQVNAATDIELQGNNLLKGGSVAIGTMPAIKVSNTGSLVLCNEQVEGRGRLYAYGGFFGTDDKPAIMADTGGSLTIEGGTIFARRGDDNKGTADIEGALTIKAGSVDALSKTRPTNNSGKEVFRVSVTTGLNPDEPYVCTYNGCEPTTFTILPDAAGKVYCWQPEQLVSADKTKVTLTHPVSYEKTEIEVVQVEKNDANVAPIVIRLTDKKTGEKSAYGNLRDAFDAMQAGTEDQRNSYDLQLLTRINNLRTRQKVPAYTDASLDLGSFEIAAQNGSDVAFDAMANGAYLQIGGKGNIKNTFKIGGDLFVTGVVPLTDAVVELDGKAVFRTLVRDLPVATGNTYTYSYGQQQNVPFYLHDGLACLWLPDYGRSEELRFTVGGTGGSNTEYTAGNITTVTQRTEAIPASPVGVVARLTYGNGAVNQAFNTLQEAFAAAGKASVDQGVKDATVHLLTGVSISGTLNVTGSFILNLDGKNVTSASGGLLQIGGNARMVITDATAGTKGSLQTDISLVGDGQLFVPGSIRLTGNVYKASDKSLFLWRTLVNMNYQSATVTKVIYEGVEYPVIGREVCLWLPANDDAMKAYPFTFDGKTETVVGYQISAGKHDNDMTLGGSNNVARIGTQEHVTLKGAFDAVQNGEIIELLKTVSLEENYTVTAKNITIELGKYELTGNHTLTVGNGASLVVKSQSGSGRLDIPVVLSGTGNLYIGQDIPGGGIGAVSNSSGTLNRLLVSNLPGNIPTGTHAFTFVEIDTGGQPVVGEQQNGTFMVREGVGCLWLEEQVARRLTFTVGGASFVTENVTVNPDHFNIETYGVSDVAQIRNGKKYRDLATAFSDASGKTIVLLKNAALKEHVTVTGNVVLEMGDYTIISQEVGSQKAVFTIPSAANLQVTGKGSLNADFEIKSSSPNMVNSNGNLQIDKAVTLLGQVRLGTETKYRVNVEGLPVTQAASYEFSGQKGAVLISSSGNICLWMDVVGTPTNFFVEVGTTTYQATSVTVAGTHSNPVSVTPVSAVAGIGGSTFDTLEDAFINAKAGDEIKLRKAVTMQGSVLNATGGDVTLSLDGNRLTAGTAGLSLDAAQHQLLVRGGTLSGAISVSGNIYVDGDVIMTNAYITRDSKTAWRTLVILPVGTTRFSYKLGGEALTECNNIQNVGGIPIACLWLPSSNVARSFTVEAGNTEYVLNNIMIASTHGNELDMNVGNDPVAVVGGNTYATLASALAVVAEGETVFLKKDLAFSSIQTIDKNITFDLEGHNLTSNGSGFEVADGQILNVTNGMLLGTFRMKGEGKVSAGLSVKIAGIVLDNADREVFRTLIKVSTVMQCHWMTPVALESDLAISYDTKNWEVTIPAGLSNHNMQLTAYEQILLSGNGNSWKPEYANTNLVLAADAVLDVSSVTANTSLHRLTISDGAKIVTSANTRVVADEGIRYVRTFATDNQWESIALPFTADRVTALLPDATAGGMGKTTLLVPATASGTAGHFWLKMLDIDGRLQTVSSAEMTANVSYLMAVPSQLKGKAITFVSGGSQLLRRDKVLAVKPASGFASYANGTLDDRTIGEPCYLLSADGATYVRQENAVLEPFRGFLLADISTTTITPTFRLGTPTHLQPIVPQSLKAYGGKGRLILESATEEMVTVHTLSGHQVASFILREGRREIWLPAGLYLVNRMKIIVK